MADNVVIGSGATTPVDVPTATDNIAGVNYQRVKISVGDDGTAADVGPSNPLPVSDNGGSLTVDFASQPLPTGAATAAKQPALGTAGTPSADVLTVQGNASGTPIPVSGALSVTGTMPISTAAAAQVDGHSATLGSTTDAAATTTGSVIAQLRRIANLVAGTLTVSGTVTTTPPSNASSNVAQINGVTPLMGAGNTGTGSLRVTLSTDQTQLTNALKVDPSAVTSPVSLASQPLPTGAATAANQLLPVQAGTATLANVAGSASSVTLQASNAARKGLTIVNDSTAILYVKFGSAASTTSFSYYLAGSVGGVPATLELPAASVYTGIVTGIWGSATGSARMTELS